MAGSDQHVLPPACRTSPDLAGRRREQRVQEWSQRISRAASRFLLLVSAHWLLLANLFFLLYVGLPVLAPVLQRLGYSRLAGVIYAAYRPFCHQRPDRSFFLFGESACYSPEELALLLGESGVWPRYVGGPGIGYKVAICQRDVAIYATMFVAGVVFHFLRKRLRPLRAKEFVILMLPMAVDGLGQLFGLWTSTWFSRVVTGALFGLACVLLVFPYLEEGMQQVHEEMATALEGRRA